MPHFHNLDLSLSVPLGTKVADVLQSVMQYNWNFLKIFFAIYTSNNSKLPQNEVRTLDMQNGTYLPQIHVWVSGIRRDPEPPILRWY